MYVWLQMDTQGARASGGGSIRPGGASFFINIQCEIQFGLFHILSLVLGPTHKPKQNCDCCQRQMIASKQMTFQDSVSSTLAMFYIFKASFLWMK